MVDHFQSGDQNMAPEGSAWQAMPHFCEIGCNTKSAHKCKSYRLSVSLFGTGPCVTIKKNRSFFL